MKAGAASLRGFALRMLRRRRGQVFAEYLLMMAVVALFLFVSFPLFYQNILGAFFLIVGKVLGG